MLTWPVIVGCLKQANLRWLLLTLKAATAYGWRSTASVLDEGTQQIGPSALLGMVARKPMA